VLSEVGSKESGILISPSKWVSMMRTELDAGSWKVIAEARESGTVGIYRPSGHAHTTLVNRILSKVAGQGYPVGGPPETPAGLVHQTTGCQRQSGQYRSRRGDPVGNLALGVARDTFFQYLPEEVADKLRQVKPDATN
jgi:phosphosulfolactate synthase